MVLLVISDGNQIHSGDGKFGRIRRADLGTAVPAGLRPGGLLLNELVAFESVGIIGPTIKTPCI